MSRDPFFTRHASERDCRRPPPTPVPNSQHRRQFAANEANAADYEDLIGRIDLAAGDLATRTATYSYNRRLYKYVFPTYAQNDENERQKGEKDRPKGRSHQTGRGT